MHELVTNLTEHVWIFVFGAILIPVAWLKVGTAASVVCFAVAVCALVAHPFVPACVSFVFLAGSGFGREQH